VFAALVEKIMHRVGIAMALTTVIALAACGSSGSQAKGTGGPIEGVRWILETIDVEGTPTPVPAGVTIDATFEDGRVAGSGACNAYTARYELEGPELVITGMSSTQKACAEGALPFENGYTASLANADTYTATADALTIYDIPGTALLVYRAGGTAGPVDPLVGDWEVAGYDNGTDVVAPIADTEMTVSFEDDGTIAGSGGCNTYDGTYTADGGTLTIGPLAATRVACDEAIMTQEQQFLAALGGAVAYQTDGGEMALTSADGSIAVKLTAAN
jgi:heat shock protein HslJ